MEYVLPLSPSEGTSNRRVTTLHLLLAFALGSLGVGCLLLFWFTARARVFSAAYWYNSLPPAFKTANAWFALFGVCALIAGIGVAVIAVRYRKWLQVGQRNTGLRAVEIFVLLAACLLFFLTGQNFPAAIFGALALLIALVTALELRAPSTPKAIISEAGIQVPKGSFTKTYAWTEIEAVLLRHGILSIELSGNRLTQRMLPENPDLDIAEIESFCRVHINKHEKARAAANAW